MKKILFLSFFVFSASFLFAQRNVKTSIDIEVIIGNRAPAPNEARMMESEEREHPNIAKAMHDIGDAIQHLHDAPNDFGGHKAQAEADLKQAWVSLRKALYFRLYH
jgi:hypothetical protein